MFNKYFALLSFLILCSVLVSVSIGDQPPGVELNPNPNGTSKILWMFDTPKDDWINTASMGKVGHEGDDYYADDWSKPNAEKTVKGQIAYAGISGKAIVLPFDPDGYGNHVVIYDSSSGFALRYAHLDEILAKDGQDVVAGVTPMGKVGNTGNVAGPTGYHLHIVLYKNVTSEKGRPITTISFNRPDKNSIGPPTTYAAPFQYNPRKVTGTPPPAPVIISPGTKSEPGEPINTLTPTFRWNAVTNADRYGLFISKYPYGAENIIFRKEDLTGTSYTLPAGYLQDGMKYRWNMQAYNSAGWGNVSDRLYFEVKLSAPPVSTTRTLTITSAEVAPGSKVTVQVNVSDATGIDGGDIKIKYNQNIITIVNVKNTALTSSLSLVSNTNVPGEITIAMAGVDGIKSGSGALVDIELMAKPNSQPGTETPLEFIEASVYNVGKNIPVNLKNGVIKITKIDTGTKTERTLSIASVDTMPNAQVSAQIKINDAKGVAAGDIVIKYDPNFLTIGEIKGSDLISGMNLAANTSVSGKIMIGIAGAQGIPSGSGALVYITLKVKPDIKTGSETMISFDSDTQIYDELGNVIPVKLESGVIRMRGIKGDVNNDGKISASDAILALRMSVELIVPDEYQKWAADMNDDGKIKTNDVLVILRISVGLSAPKMDTFVRNADEIAITFAEERNFADKRITIPLIVDNAKELAGGDVCIAYNNKLLRAVNVSSDQDLLIASNINKPGIIRLAFTNYGTLSKGTIAEIQFDVLADGVSSLSIKNAELYRWDGSIINSRRIDKQLSSWIAVPERNALLQNFPNPFNPETWIPYQLKDGGDVMIRIYSVTGELVREFNIGYKPVGLYISQDRAVYWDGKNERGEKVSSGIYFYTIKAGEFTAERKMVISE